MGEHHCQHGTLWILDQTKNVQHAKTWNVSNPAQEKQDKNEELHLDQILPAHYKLVDISEVVLKQTHLTSVECEKLLHTTLISFPDFFQGQCGEYNDKPITLELLPGSKPFYAKLFSIPKSYYYTKE
jgi:hypothetical protein